MFEAFPMYFTDRYYRFFRLPLFTGLLSLFIITCNLQPEKPEIIPGKELQPGANVPGGLKTLRLLTYWYPTAQFAGYIVGAEKGIFRKHGIDLQILKYDQRQKMEDIIRMKKAEFMVSWLVNSLKMRDNRLDIINIAQFSFRSSLMLITKKSSGINALEKMQGKRAGIWLGYELQPLALFHKFNLDVKIIPIGSTNNLFLMDGVDILNANEFDEYHTVLNSGYDEHELNTFRFYDYGFNFLEDGLYCLESFATLNPVLCRKFVEATIESWQYAFDHHDESVSIVIKEAKKQNYPVNFSHQSWMLQKYHELYVPKNSRKINRKMSEDDYLKVAKIMKEAGLLKSLVPFHSFYKPVFTD